MYFGKLICFDYYALGEGDTELELLGVGVFEVLALGLVLFEALVLGLGVGVAVLGGVETVGTVPGAVLAYQYQIAPPTIRTITIIIVNARPVLIPFLGSSMPGVVVVSSIFLLIYLFFADSTT